jgi:putative membrane protein
MPDQPPPSPTPPAADDSVALVPLAARGAIGGALMGLANLVPGISGGTMLLAAGVYPRFVAAVADVSTLRLRRASVVLLAAVVAAAVIAIVALAAPLRDLVVERRWIMYSLFIGLTLGGVPLLLRMVRPAARPDVLLPAAAGLAVMIAMAFLQPGGGAGGSGGPSYLLSFVAGLAGASAMVLPGVSGGYLLLLLGMYVPILDAIATAKSAAGDRDLAAFAPALHVIVPVGIGVVVGIVGVSNLVRVLLQRAERPTVGVLLGLLLGAVVGLWPFQAGVAPAEGETFRGDRVVLRDGVPFMETADREIEPKNWPTATFTPTAVQAAAAAGLIAAGLGVSLGIGRLGREKPGRA